MTYLSSESRKKIVEHSGGKFLKVNYDHFQFFDGDQLLANVFSFILGLVMMKSHDDESIERLNENEGWFRCPASMIQQALWTGKDSQQRTIRELISRKIIAVSNRSGNVMWIRFNIDCLDDIDALIESTAKPHSKIRVLQSRVLNTAKPQAERCKAALPCNKNLNKHLKESSRPSPSGDSDSTLFSDSKNGSIDNPPSNFHSTLAEQIYSKVEKRIPRRIKISMWVSELVKLEQFIIKSSKVLSKKAQKIMKEEIGYHLLHLDSERQPQAYSPKSMLERWPQITIANRIRREAEGIETEHAMSFEDEQAPKETKWTTRIISDEEWNKMQKESAK